MIGSVKEIFVFLGLKVRTEILITGDPPYKDGDVPFTTVPLKPLSDKEDIVVFLGFKVIKRIEKPT